MRCISCLLLTIFIVGPAFAQSEPATPEHPSQAGLKQLTATKGPLRAEQVDAAISYLEANRKAYEDDEIEPYRQIEEWLHAVGVDDTSAQAVADAIGKVRGRNEPFYVASHLMIPFMHSQNRMPSRQTAETLIQAIEPLARRARFRRIPVLGEGAIQQLQMPPAEAASKASPQKLLQAVAAVQRRRDAKYRREYPLIVNNQLAWDIKKSLWRMKVIVATGEQIDEITQEALDMERDGNAMSFYIMKAVEEASAAGRLSKEDMTRYWEAFSPRYNSLPKRSDHEAWRELPPVTGYLIHFNVDDQSTYTHDMAHMERRHAYFPMLNELARKLGKPTPPNKD